MMNPPSPHLALAVERLDTAARRVALTAQRLRSHTKLPQHTDTDLMQDLFAMLETDLRLLKAAYKVAAATVPAKQSLGEGSK